MRLIDADAFIRNFSTWMNHRDEEHGDSNFVLGIKLMLEELQNAPTVDPVKHGHWISASPLTDTLVCSECQYNIIDEAFKTPYCPNCGAKMDEGGDAQ